MAKLRMEGKFFGGLKDGIEGEREERKDIFWGLGQKMLLDRGYMLPNL